MKLLTRLFARYAAHVGYLDGKRNFPGEHDFVEVGVHGGEGERSSQPRGQDAEVLKIAEAAALSDRKQ
jgi:hypothetical protein